MKALAVDVERNLRSPAGRHRARGRPGSGCPSPTSPSPCARATPLPTSGAPSPAPPPTCSSRRPSRCSSSSPRRRARRSPGSRRSSSTRCTPWPAPSAAPTWPSPSSGSTPCSSARRSASGCPPPSSRSRRSPATSPAADRSRSCSRPRPRSGTSRSSCPIPDMSALGEATGRPVSGPAAGEERRASIWPHVEERIVDLVAEHRSTLVFSNSPPPRRAAHHPAQRDLGGAARGRRERAATATRPARCRARRAAALSRARPAQVMAQSGASPGRPRRARPRPPRVGQQGAARQLIEEDLKAGRLPAVVATSSLELGIDMGAVDLVVQVESPPSVASGLQRVGRAGHQVGAVSPGRAVPEVPRRPRPDRRRRRADARRGRSRRCTCRPTPLDVLAQQVVAMCALDEWTVDDARAAGPPGRPRSPPCPARSSSRCSTCSPGRYPSDEFAELRAAHRLGPPDRHPHRPPRRPAARRHLGRHHPRPRAVRRVPRHRRGRRAAGRRARRGDGLRVAGRRRVHPRHVAPGGSRTSPTTGCWSPRRRACPGGCRSGRATAGPPGRAGPGRGRVRPRGRGARPRAGARAGRWPPASTSGPPTTCSPTCASSARPPATCPTTAPSSSSGSATSSATGGSPSTRRSARRCTRPGRCACRRRMRERFGVDVQAMHGDDGIVLRLPDLEFDDDGVRERGVGRELLDLVAPRPRRRARPRHRARSAARRCSRRGSASARPAPCCCPAAAPTGASRCGSSASGPPSCSRSPASTPTFPIVLEAVRECVQDVFDVPGLIELMRDIELPRGHRSSTSRRRSPSPFARSLLFGYVAQFLYEGDSPLAERRAAALALDPTLLAELLGRGEGLALRDLLDPEQVDPHRGRAAAAHARARLPRRRGRRRPAARRSGRCPSTTIVARCREDA